MQWDRFFDDVEQQFAGEQAAERAALESESTRLRLAAVTFRERLLSFAVGAAFIRLSTEGGDVSGVLSAVGVDWVALDGAAAGAMVVPLGALLSVGVERTMAVSVERSSEPRRRALEDTMTWGFIMRDFMRRRIPVTLILIDGKQLSGTIDRAGADHLDLALHDRGVARRESEVTGLRLVPFGAIASLRLDTASSRI
ncbi:hypothetical protein FHX48_001691 [Microbacterium halimionae]|uniref:Uncharacterized protein n=1 Tax=Microbacterium halimionae TaxID=1526413 RepID=A0A7W3JPQ7_9MICO|nr:hypothetical protein [Microbacterium halimionae]MBA8816618.1 hypothetical protein [Microbacterium halimionae]NII95195.1 hypothetical protein [Microbacterium halimionae]